MHWYLWLILALLVAPTVLLYLGIPLLLRSSFWQVAEVEFAPTRLEDLSETGRQSFARMVNQLIAEGFVVVSNLRTVAATKRVMSIQILFIHPQTRTVAVGIFTSAGPEERQQTWTMSFRTYFSDKTQIATGSAPAGSVFPADPSIDFINAFWLKDPRLLYAIHQARITHSPRAAEPRILPNPGTEIEFQKEEWREVTQRVAKAGYLRLDRSSGKYRPTLKGAYIMTWRMLWPLKPLRLAARKRKAIRVMKELGFEQATIGA